MIGARRQAGRNEHREPDPTALEARQRELDGHLDGVADVHVLERLRGVAIAHGEIVERARQTHQTLGFFAKRREGVGGRRDDTVAKRLQVADQIGQRRSQLVRGVRDELRAEALLLLQPLRHAVEGRGERGDLPRTIRRHAHVTLPLGDALCRRADATEWARQPAGEDHSEHDAADDPDEDRHGDESRHAAVEHRARVVHGGAVFDHELLERSRREHEDAEHDHDDRDRRDRHGGDGHADRHGPHDPVTAR